MAPKVINNKALVSEVKEVVVSEVKEVLEVVKAKRGRKSKKDLMASLNMELIVKDKDKNISNKSPEKNDIISLNVNEIKTDSYNSMINTVFQNVYENNLDNTDKLNTDELEDINANIADENNIVMMSKRACNTDINDNNTDENDNNTDINDNNTDINDNENNTENNTDDNNIVIISKPDSTNEKPASKKRGRKPKGGKIIQQVLNNVPQQEDKPNVILHLKCSMKDLQNTTHNNGFIESYSGIIGKNDLTYEVICNENNNTFNEKNTSTMSILESEYEVENNDNSTCKDCNKEIWKKIKHLEHNLHINNVNNKRSACFWDTCEFDNPPIYIPKHFINGTYHVYGCFCSPECGVAYLMNESIDSSAKFERYHLFNHIYAKIYDYNKNIKPAPNPYYMLEKYYGNLSIQEYRSLLRNERLFLIVDKPLTRILPELHEDNDDFILNNKIIPSNTYQVKARLQRKKQNKTLILNEQFGLTNQSFLE
jgi:hypothetical protein